MNLFEILIVEDDSVQRYLLCNLLRKHGYTTREARDGQEALDLLEARQVNLIISDWMMPNLDGRQLLTAIRANSRRAGLPFILMSSTHLDPAPLTLADRFITKPYRSAELVALVRELLEPQHA